MLSIDLLLNLFFTISCLFQPFYQYFDAVKKLSVSIYNQPENKITSLMIFFYYCMFHNNTVLRYMHVL